MGVKVDGLAAIVTGGASGLGAATGRALADAGARVALLDLNESAAAEVAGEIGGIALGCDVSDAASGEAAVARAAEAHGPARILVNCAGIAPAARIVGRNGPASLEAYAKVIQVNLIGSFNMMRLVAAGALALEPLEGGERGVIISTASVAAYEGQIGQAAYASSKAGVVGLTLPAAREFASSGIRVCAIAPGIFETPMLRGLPQEVQDSLGASVPFPSRLGRPEEYAMLVMAIIANPMLNGEVIRLDGALRMQPR
jgi:NAD(P)-dependent dehydrogenase (short-subunit alcohol dehydrogenase family)